MKKFLFLLCGIFAAVSANAQASLSERYYINRAKSELENGLVEKVVQMLAEKEVEVIIVGAEDGILSYVIADGVRTEFNVVEPESAEPRYWYPPYLEPQPRKVKNKNDFAQLMQRLYKSQWRVKNLAAFQEKEVYLLER